jgi:flagellar basal-body rod protein FlgB
MSLNGLAVFDVLRGTMSMLGERQKVLARNIANANTPGYVAKDIDQKNFAKMLAGMQSGKRQGGGRLAMQVSDPAHISGAGGKAAKAYKVVASPDSETTLNGNTVVLEEQVMRVAETRMRYEAAAGLYEKSMSLLRMAISRPGR